MDLISLLVGIAIGAAFSPFWIKMYGVVKAKVVSMQDKTPPSA